MWQGWLKETERIIVKLPMYRSYANFYGLASLESQHGKGFIMVLTLWYSSKLFKTCKRRSSTFERKHVSNWSLVLKLKDTMIILIAKSNWKWWRILSRSSKHVCLFLYKIHKWLIVNLFTLLTKKTTNNATIVRCEQD